MQPKMTAFNHLFSRSLLWSAFAVAILIASGCSDFYTDYDAFLHDSTATISTNEYKLAPPDSIRIYSKRVKELDRYGDVIRPDGKITLPLVGTVYANGMTSEELGSIIRDRAKDYYADADITVQVTGFNSKKIFVFGEVSVAGPYSYDGANTVLETLAAAQPTRLADPSRIHLLRPRGDGVTADRMTISLDDMVRGGDTTFNAILEEGDIIFVPPNSFAAVGLALQQLLLPLQPAAATVRNPAEIEDDIAGTTYGRDVR